MIEFRKRLFLFYVLVASLYLGIKNAAPLLETASQAIKSQSQLELSAVLPQNSSSHD